ncbi:MAG: GspE/PulE family protein [Patescibacteria group bacterium]|nr:GspE/PulE family protein [Patescibacteria group bacterium]
MNLLQFLISKEKIEEKKVVALDKEAKLSDKKIEQVILDNDIMEEQDLFEAKSEQLGIELKDVEAQDVPLKVLELMPEESAKYYKIIPLSIKDDIVEIGMVYPEDLKTREALKFLAQQGNFSYKIFLIKISVFNNAFKRYKNLKQEMSHALEKLETEIKTKKSAKARIQARKVGKMVEEAPITKMVTVMLKHAVDGNASDIHIEPTKEKLRVRFRLDGVLHSSLFLPIKVHLAVVARIKVLSNLKLDESRIPQDGRFSLRINDKDIDFRVSTFPTTLGEKVVLRVLDPSRGLKTIEDLGLNQRDYSVVQRGAKRPYGLILTTGPTGSGKSTTLYTILQFLNKQDVNIITLEDPVEYFMEGINQSQIRPEIGYSFAQGLRHTLRQDPDIIMVGEIRDKETAELAIHAALTGHIVLSTIHTIGVAGVIPRLIDLGVESFLIASSLSLCLSQRLVRKLCVFCKEKHKANAKIKRIIEQELKGLPIDNKQKHDFLRDSYIWEAKGCKKCNNQGYSGRIGIFETLEMTKSLGDIVVSEHPTDAKISSEAKKQGIITMKQDGILKVLQGLTSIQEILRVTEEEKK